MTAVTVRLSNCGGALDADQVLIACRRFTRAVDGFDAAAARRIGVNRTDLRALNLLEAGPVSQVPIATALGITRPSVTALVDRLEQAGFVRRMADSQDRRATQVELLPATWHAFADVYRPVGEQVPSPGRSVERDAAAHRDRSTRCRCSRL